MQWWTVITVAGGVLGATIAITAFGAKVWKWIAIRSGRLAVNHIRKQDISPNSYVGEWAKNGEKTLTLMAEANAISQGMRDDINRNHVHSLQVELRQLIYNTPEKTDIIEEIYANYLSAGGSSVALGKVMEEWRKVYLARDVKKQVGDGV